MNYMKELNAFREWLLVNQIPTSAIALWYTLMSINNLARWKQTFNAPNAVVQQLTGLSKQGIIDARNILIKHELIECVKGGKGRAPVYQMHSLVQTNTKKMDQLLDRPSDEDLNIRIRKQNKTKTNKIVHPFVKNVQERKLKNKILPFQTPTSTLFDELRKEAGI